MSSRNPFASPRSRWKRGKEHAAKLKKRSDSFFKTVPRDTVREKEPNGFELLKFKIEKPLPEVCTHYAAEALEALRSALDQTGYAAAVVSGVAKPKNAKFPFGDTAPDVDNDIRRGCRDLPPDIQALFRSFKPYKGGNDILWALNKLRNATHTTLIPVGTTVGGIHIHNMAIAGPIQIPAPKWDSEKNEMIFARGMLPGTKLEYDLDFRLFVAFEDVQPVGQMPAINGLMSMVAEVKRVMDASEAGCRKLGYNW